MTRATKLGSIAGVSFLLWFIAITGIINLPFSETFNRNVVPIIPLWLLVSFGSYALCNIGYNLLTFRECPNEYHLLMEEINESKSFMRSKGVEVY
ncbi:hypothetical protein BB558_005573 [Smittium angustum]|uniref:Dolichol-phosphate mannosyltransferase subunit 3 n=1 Tax=Smittium angustum TaxID=133377 RepID=A0A2U1J037_SMIAN|nr:hypothetical protein BB558_005573 [Smittium angustum]